MQLPNILAIISKQAIVLFIILLLGVTLFFSNNALPPVWILIGVSTVFLSFRYFSLLLVKWAPLPEKIFRKRIFWTALLIRVGYVVASYLFYVAMTGEPFEFAAADSRGYHYQGLRIAEYFRMGQFDISPLIFFEKVSSRGVMILMGTVYALFEDSIIIFRIVNALLGAWACVIIYDITKRAFDLHAARISAVMAMVAPPLIFYCGLHLKEAIILFLVVFFINVADRLLRERQFSAKDLILLFGTVIVMFLFRNSLTVALILSFIAAMGFTSGHVSTSVRRFIIGFVFAFSLFVIVAINPLPEAQEEAMYYFDQRGINIEIKMKQFATRKDGNRLASFARKGIFAPLGLIGPLPTLVATVGQEDIIMRAGSMFYRNVFAFFALYALYLMVKLNQWRNHILLLAIFFSWLFILANSGYGLSDRFHLIFAPIVIILCGYGITMAREKALFNFKLYLLFLGGLIFAWNIFKLAGRGLV